jgi:hypothetical protein
VPVYLLVCVLACTGCGSSSRATGATAPDAAPDLDSSSTHDAGAGVSADAGHEAGGSDGGAVDGSGSSPVAGGTSCVADTFAAAATTWSLPSYGTSTFQGGVSGNGCPTYASADMNGDRIPDLVVVDDCKSGSTVGTSHWDVYLGTRTSGFPSTATTWALPAYGTNAFTAFATTPGGVGCLQYTPMEVNGDGIMDLVVTEDCTTGSNTGTDHWNVYFGTPSGFSTTATTWSLPAYGASALRYAQSTGCPGYATDDLNGDRILDLVVIDDCNSTSDVGTSHWLAYFGSSSGFASSAQSWPLPSFGARAFSSGLASTGCPSYSVLDMNGDRKPDLVVTRDCSSTSNVGTSDWSVYLNTGTAYPTTATSWTLPAYGPSAFIGGPSARAYCAGGVPGYATVDMTGDALPDLVVSDDCISTTNVGTDHWLIYANGGTSFSGTSSSWTLPAYGANVFQDIRGTSCPNYTTADANGDGILDLIVTDDCRSNTNVGTSLWNAYLGKCGSP